MVLNLRKIQYHPFEPVFADLALLLDAAKTGICSADIHEPIKTKNPTAYWLWDFNLWEDYKIDFFAFLGVVFVPLRKILSFQG